MRSEDVYTIDRLKAGDMEVFSGIFDTYAGAVKSYAQQQLKNKRESDQLTCDAFIRLYIDLHEKPQLVWQHVSFEHLFFFVVKEMVQEARQARRAARALEKFFNELPMLRSDDPEQVTLRNELWAKVHDAIGRLPQDYQAAARLVLLEENELTDVARALRRPLGTIKTHMRRVRQLLGKFLSAYFDGGRV